MISPARRSRATRSRPLIDSPWDELRVYLGNNPFEDMLQSHPEISEALALIKHAGPDPHQVEPLTVALRLLVEATIAIAKDIHYVETSLARVCNLLHEHLEICGLQPSEGRWHLDKERPPGAVGRPDPLLEQLYSRIFPPSSGGEMR